jgi:AcrR family transcriptional regulator
MAETDTRSRVSLRRKPREERAGTRAELLEAAGQIFAEKGFDRATGREICERAGANPAAINYHFGGMEGLYAAVIDAAFGRLLTLEKLNSAIAGKADAKAKLTTIIELAVDLLTGPISASWVLRVVGREFVAPSFALEALIQKEGIPKARILRAIAAELMGLSEDDPAVARGCLTLIAPCAMLLIADRRTLRRALPGLALKRENAPALARHLLHYALGGLAAAAREAQ